MLTNHVVSLIFALANGLVVLSARTAASAEPVEQFATALRSAGYHDMAVLYLSKLSDHPGIDADFKSRLPYELAAVLVESALATPDRVERDRKLSQAQDKLRAFILANSDGALATTANFQLAGVLLLRGQMLAASSQLAEKNKAELRSQARALFDEAISVFTSLEKSLVEQFNQQPPDTANPDAEKRRELPAQILNARLQIALALREKAKTYDDTSDDSKRLLADSSKRFQALQGYLSSDWNGAAFLAMVHEAENHLTLKDPKTALEAIADVIKIKPGNPAERDLVIAGFLVALKARLQLEDFETAIDQASGYVSRPMLNEVRQPKWIEAQYLLATAYERQAGTLKGSDVEKQKALREARLLAAEIVKYPSDVQDDVRALLTRVGFVDPEKKSEHDSIDLATALEQAAEAIGGFTATREAIPKDVAADDLQEMRKQLNAQRDVSMNATDRAMRIASQSSEIDKVNQARFLLCYLHWEIARSEASQHRQSTHFYDAAVLGDFLGRHYPKHEHSRQAAAIALASYQLLGNQHSESARLAAENEKRPSDQVRAAQDKAVEPWSRRITELAQYIAGKWPESQEATSAYSNLATIAAQRGDLETAIEYIGKLKAGSPQRTDVELRIGRALWADTARSGKVADQSPPPSAQSADDAAANSGLSVGPSHDSVVHSRAKQAQTLLESALTAVRKTDAIDRETVLGVWALIQSYISTRQHESAIAWLEDEKIGLLSLVNSKHEAADIPGLTFDAYRLALRAYIGSKPQQLDKATSAMDALERIALKDDAGAEKLTQIYTSLGRELQRELAALNEGGHNEQVRELTKAFETFLQRLVERSSGNNFNSLFWVADTYSELAAGLAQNPDQPKSEASRAAQYYAQAAKGFEQILERAESDPPFMPSKYAASVQVKLAKAYRGAGRHNDALSLLVKTLKDNQNILTAQFEAAYAYQQFADTDPQKRAKFYTYAVTGGQTGDYTVIWGWRRLSNTLLTQERQSRRDADAERTAQADEYRDRFFEARYNSSYCIYAAALAESDATKQQKLLKVAKNDIFAVYSVVSQNFGGGVWNKRNDQLLKKIQAAAREPTVGLIEFKDRPTAEAAKQVSAK